MRSRSGRACEAGGIAGDCNSFADQEPASDFGFVRADRADHSIDRNSDYPGERSRHRRRHQRPRSGLDATNSIACRC